jgi:hypothetical protein
MDFTMGKLRNSREIWKWLYTGYVEIGDKGDKGYKVYGYTGIRV